MLTSPTHLRDTLVELDRDLGGLPGRRVALLGFRDANPTRVADNVHALCRTPGWTVIDLRHTPEQLPAILPEALAAPRLALLVDVAAPLPTDVPLRTAPSRSAPCNPAREQPGRKCLPATNSEDDISLPAECLGERPRRTRANSRRRQRQQARADGPRPRLLAAWACHCWR